MKKYLLFVLILIITTNCKKENNNPFENYGCVYGVSKITGQREYIRCSYHEIYTAGYNQTAANNVADTHSVPRENVTNMQNYTNWEWIATTDCNCN